MNKPKTLKELEEFIRKVFPKAVVDVDPATFEVRIRTGKFLTNGDKTCTLHDELEGFDEIT